MEMLSGVTLQEDLLEKVKEDISDQLRLDRNKLADFMGVLFWKDTYRRHIEMDDIREFISVLDTLKKEGPEGEEYYTYDMDKLLVIVNKMRAQISLPKVVISPSGSYLMEEPK